MKCKQKIFYLFTFLTIEPNDNNALICSNVRKYLCGSMATLHRQNAISENKCEDIERERERKNFRWANKFCDRWEKKRNETQQW